MRFFVGFEGPFGLVFSTVQLEGLGASPRPNCVFWECKNRPGPVQMGFGEGLLKDKFAFFEASKYPMPKRRKSACKMPLSYKQRGPI